MGKVWHAVPYACKLRYGLSKAIGVKPVFILFRQFGPARCHDAAQARAGWTDGDRGTAGKRAAGKAGG
jgi:hypothetical protein